MSFKVTIDINLKASEEVTNALLTLAAVLNNSVPIFDETKKVAESKNKEEIQILEENFQEDKSKEAINDTKNNYKSNEKTNHKANENSNGKSNQKTNQIDEKSNCKSKDIYNSNNENDLNDNSKEISLPEIRELLARISRIGKRLQVKALIKKFGGKKLTDIPKDKYAELLKEAKTI